MGNSYTTLTDESKWGYINSNVKVLATHSQSSRAHEKEEGEDQLPHEHC